MIWMASLVLGVLLIEAAVFALFGRRFGLPAGDVVGMILPGGALVAALLLAVAGGGIPAVGGALLVAGVGHGYDLYRRLSRSHAALLPED